MRKKTVFDNIHFKRFFGSKRKVHISSAPGRLDVMGGIADYSGSLVLQMPIQEEACIYISQRDDEVIRVCTTAYTGEEKYPTFELSLSDLISCFDRYEELRDICLSQQAGWALYIVGCILLMMQEKKIPFKGADILLDSKIPIGKGVSSSAAIEVATIKALSQIFKIPFDLMELPIMAQRVENLIVGAPCGLMDQLASYLGRKDRLLPILCTPHHVQPAVEIHNKLRFIGVDSGVRHAVSGSSYTDVRTAAFMGYTIIAMHLGMNRQEILEAKNHGSRDSLPYHGYLAQIPPSVYYWKYDHIMPVTMSGQEFIQSYGDTIDPVTAICPDKIYSIRNCTIHPIEENHRIHLFLSTLKTLPQIKSKKEMLEIYNILGELMLQSHASYSRCGLGNERTDEIVEKMIHAESSQYVYGAKITGGGSGGTVCVLAYGDQGTKQVETIAREYADKYNIPLTFFLKSGQGAFYYRSKTVIT